MKSSAALSILFLVLSLHDASADLVGPSIADSTMSPNGKLVVRIITTKAVEKPNARPKYAVAFYEFEAKTDSYVKRSDFELTGYPGDLMYVSDAGDLAVITLGDRNALRLFSRDGKLLKAWNLDELLSAAEIKGTAQTGSTLQWLEEASFSGREFYFRGPSQVVRALRPSYTVMRGADPKVRYSGVVDAATLKLVKDEQRESED